MNNKKQQQQSTLQIYIKANKGLKYKEMEFWTIKNKKMLAKRKWGSFCRGFALQGLIR